MTKDFRYIQVVELTGCDDAVAREEKKRRITDNS